MADPGKGSTRRPDVSGNFADNFEKIFGKKKVTPGRSYYRWDSDKREFIKVDPPKALPSDLRFEGTFVSPVTGEVISNKHDLDRHNKENGVMQLHPGMEQDTMAVQKDNMDKAFGKQAKAERIEDIKKVIEQGER